MQRETAGSGILHAVHCNAAGSVGVESKMFVEMYSGGNDTALPLMFGHSIMVSLFNNDWFNEASTMTICKSEK